MSLSPEELWKARERGEMVDSVEERVAFTYVGDSTIETLHEHPELGRSEDEFDWIGRSQYAIADKLNASIDELRIYSEPFTEAQIRTSAAAGPNP